MNKMRFTIDERTLEGDYVITNLVPHQSEFEKYNKESEEYKSLGNLTISIKNKHLGGGGFTIADYSITIEDINIPYEEALTKRVKRVK